jgi:hypothetical protein
MAVSPADGVPRAHRPREIDHMNIQYFYFLFDVINAKIIWFTYLTLADVSDTRDGVPYPRCLPCRLC